VGNSSKEKIQTNLMQNIQLMLLHVRIIPESILNAIYKEIAKQYNSNSPDMHNLSSMERILEGTGFTDRDTMTTPVQFDAFSGMKIVEDKPKKEDLPKSKKLNELF